MANESTKWLYEQLTGKGYNVGKDVDEFDNLMRTNAESRRWAYETATNAGFNVGKDIDEFTSLVAPQPIQAAADVVANATNRIQPSVVGTEENGNNVPVVTPNQAAADEVVPVNDTQQSWTPSVQDKIRASYQMHTMLNDFNQKSRERIAQARRLTEPFTAEGRKKRSALAFQTQLAGSPTKVMGVMGSTPKSTADEVQGETEGATQQPQPDTQSPVPYGVEYVDGKPVTRWLMPDGRVTTNIAEADAAEYVAKQQRLHDTFANRMKQNGLDAEKQALYDAIVTGKNIAPERHKEIIDYMKSCGLDPKNNEHIKWVVKGDERSILVHRREIAGEKLKKLLARREQEEAKKDDDADFLTKLGRSANASVSHMHPTPQYNKSQINKDIEAAQAEVLLADKAVRTYDQHTGASKRNVFGKIVQGLGDALTDVNTYTFGVVDASVNKSVRDADPTSEYGRHLIETAQHAQELLATAPDPGGFYSGGRFMGSMVFDPFFYTSLGAGSLFKQGFTKAVTKTAFKDISKEAGERMLNQSLMGRLGGAAAFGAGNMAAFEGLGDMRQQLVDGGWTDSNGDFHEGFSMSHALARGGHGAIVGIGMGLWGAGFGNVANKAVQATNSAVGKVGIRAMQVPVSVIGEGTIFAMPEIIEYHTMDDDKFDRLYADKFGYADETDEEKRNKARDAARNAVSWDTWSESQAMVFAMKVAGKPMHALTNPGATIGHVTKTLSELRGKDVREHRSFAERVSQMMDRSPFDIVLTKEEREELRRAGYGELSELFRKDSNKGSTRTDVSPAEGAVEQYTERVEAEEIGGRRPEFDGYSEMERLMHDGSVSEAARAKVYCILTDHMLPMSTVTGYTKTAGEDGKITVNAVNARGEVVTSRIFDNDTKAQDEVYNITRQAELNTVDMGERYAEAQAQMRVAETAFNEVGAKHNIISDGVRNIYEKYGMGEKLSDAELAIVNDVNKLVAERMSENDTLRPESFRKRIQDNSGVDVDAALRKNAGSRTEQEQEAVNDYVDMLYKEAARDRKAREMWSDEYGQMREEERAERRRQYRSMLDGKLLEGSEPTPEQAEAQNQYEHGRELYGRFEEGDPTVQPDVDAIALRMQEAYEVFNDAFGAESEYYMFHANENPWALVNDPELTAEQQDAVLYYINAKAALDGVMDASNEAADRKRTEVEQSVVKRTHKDSGVIIPATMKVDDRQVYVVKGDVAMFPDGTGVDVRNSSESVIVMDAQTGEYEFTSPDQILKVSEAINPQDEMQSAHAVIEQEQMNIFGDNAVAPEEFTEQPRASTESLSDTIRTEDVTDAQAVPETAETVPSKVTELLTEDKNAAAVVSDAETVPQTVLSRIPVDEQGEPMLTHENVDADTAWDGAVEFFGSDADAQSYVDAQVKNVTAAITAAEKAVDKVKPTGGMKKYKEDLAKARAAVDSAKGVLTRWQAISQVSQGRKAEAEAEAAAQRAYEESITRGKEELKQAYDEVRDIPEAVEILRNMEPQSIDEVAALLLSGSKVLWNDEGVKRGVKSMLGYGEGERKGLFGLFATSKNGGETLERLAEDKMEELCNVYGIEYDNYDALTALTDVLGACRTRGDLTKYIQSRRIEQAIQAKDDFMRHIEEETERMSQEAYHMSVAERDAYEEQLFKDISGKEITDADIAEMNAIFADEIIERQRYEDNIRNEQRGAEDVLPSGATVLQGTPADYGGRVPEASSGERGVAGNGSVDRAHGAAPEGAPGTVAQIERLSKKYRSAPMKIVNSVDEIDAEDLSKETKEQIKLAHGEEGTQAVYCHENKNIYIFAGKYHDNGIDYIAAHENVHAAVDKFGLRDSEELNYWHKGVISLFSDELPNDVDEILREGIPAADFEDEFAAYTIPWISGNKRRLSKVLTSGDNWLINLFKTISEDVYGKEESERRCSLAIQDKEGADIHARPGKGLRGPGGENRGREDAAERGNDTTGSPDSEAGGNLKRRGIEQSDKVSDDFYDDEEQALAARVEVTDNDWEEGDESTPTYKRDIIIDGIHKVTQVDAPDADGYYNGSYFEFDGKRFGDLKEVADYIASGMQAEPTVAQKAAGNYKMEHRRVDGYNISIENAKGSVRRGTGADGKPWETVMQNDYGYIRGTEGVDGDHIDVFLSDTPEKGDVFVVDQVNEDGSFDEHKVMYGFPTEQAARDAYLSNYEPGWTGLGAITHVSKEEFKKWVGSSKRKTKPFAEYKSVKAIEGNGMIGRSLTEQEATELIARMKAAAEVAPSIELTPENWIAQFGEDGIVETPVGIVKMGANQLLKLYSLKRTEYFSMIHPTLNTPDVIIEKNAPAEGAERDSKYLFVKTFIKPDGSRLVHFESVTVKRDGMEVSISSHEAEGKAIKKEMQNSKILHLSESLSLSSERYLTEAPTETEGPDLVPTSDNVSSDGKVNTLSADKQTDGAESFEPYTITPTSYTNKKGKTSDVHLVKFNRELTAEEKAALDTFAREPLTEGKKTSRGWYDRKQGGYMMRSEEAARQLAEMIGNEEAVADAQPMTAEELREAVGASRTRNPKKAPINRVSLEDVMTDLSTKGEAKLSDHAEPVKTEPEQQHEISDDEMQSLADELRELLGIGDDEGDTNIKFRDPGELTPQERQRIQSAGIRFAMAAIERGTTAFPDYAAKMVGAFGDKIRPWLKSFYEGARWTPGYEKYSFTPSEQVATFDVQNFDKKQADPIKLAAMIVEERKVGVASAQAQKELTEIRNKNRRENDKQTEADTAALAEKAEAVAGEAEVTVQSAGTGEAGRKRILRGLKRVDDTLEEVNDQLALLGYYEAEEVDKDFNEAYGYMRNAEKKAVKDAVDLAKQLVNDLGLGLDKVTGATTANRGKRKNAVTANIAPAGGDISIRLPLNEGRELYITIGLAPSVTPGDVTHSGDNLQATRIMYRVEWPDEKGHVSFDHTGRNCWADANVTYADLLKGIQREAKEYIPYTSSEQPKEEVINNGYKVGDEVMWDRYGNNKWEKVKIEDFDADGSPIFEAVKGVMSEKVDWSRVKPADGIFGEAKRVARAEQEKKKKATADAVATLTGNKSKKSRKKDVTLKPDEPIGGLFADLNEEPQKQETNERKGNQPSQEVAGGELAHPVGTDATGTNGRVSSAGTEPTDKGRATHEAGAGVERGTDRPTHGTDENRGLQPVVGNRGRDESGTDSRSADTAVERRRTAGAGSVSERGTDRGTERLSEGESSAVAGRGSGTPAVKKPKKPEVKYTHNFRYDEENGSEADTYTPSQRLEANVKAIETLAEVLFGDKPATDEQKAIMSRFRGWGQVDLGKFYDIDHILRSAPENAPISRLARVIKRLDPSGDKKLFDAIKRASLSSYYTPTPIARAINSFLALAGYKGGSLLDPSMGNGMFEGTLPKSIQERTSITGVELDWLSGQLSRALYPDANVMISAFEKSGIAPGSFDVVTSNVPFGDIVVNDPTWKNDGTPLKRSAQNRIHNYYAVKMLEATRPGGLVAMMTTSAVMDTQSNQNIRAHIADQGEILGAIRLPDNTFQGTGVVTDIIFVRKWRDEQDREQTRADESYMERERAFLSQHEKTAPNKLDGSKQQVSFNGYYKLNPRNLIGEIQAGNQYGKKDAFGLTSKLTVDEIASEVEKAIKRIVGSRRGSLFNPSRTIRETQQAIREAYKGNGDWVSNGNLVVQDGKVGVLTAKSNEYGEVTRTFEGSLKHDRMLPRIEAMIELRTKMKTLIAFEIEGEKEHHIAAARAELQKAYDNFVGKFGRLQDKDNSFILDDIDGYTLQALEIWKNGNFVGLSDIFTKNSIKPSINLEGRKTPQEAVALSLAEYGYLRPDYLAKALGEDWVDQCGDFVFLKPNSEDDYVTRDEYLSGDVVTKLADARAAAEKDKSFERNVKALKEVQPERIPFDDITIHLGARWIPEEVLNDFVNELLGIHAVYSNRGRKWDPERKMYVNEQKSGVRYIPETDSFEINIEKKELGGEASDWETPKKSAKEILQAALEDKTLVITYKDKEGNTHVDDEQTELANQKIADLRERFETWLPSDPARVDLMEQLYNDRFNRTVIRHFDGSHLIVPGLMGKELRPHQKDAVWMLINNRGGIVDHIVGAGKTLVMQSAIMEMRRMGIAKKPMIVALKSTVAQIAREFKEAFPSARVLAPNDSDFKKENRKKFIANISLNDYDCVILSHEQYCMLPHTEEAERAVIDEQMWQLDNMIEYLYGTNDTSQMTKKQIKALEKRRENLKARLEKRLDRAVDREFCFENLGVDYLFVDESHQFKALPYVTSYQKVAGLGDPQGSNRAVALLTGIRHLQRIHQGDKGTVFLSGTTITNSLVETYNLLNYLRPRKLEELGMPTFDAWASTFAVHTSELEATITGGFALKDRFRQFDNVAELSQLYAEIADVRNDQNLKLPKPGIDAHTVIVPASDAMSEINSEIVNMIESKDGKYFGIYPKDPNRAPWGLHASTISAKAAVSPRLIFSDMDDDGGKVHAVCENVKKYYDEMAEQRGVQLIFCEMGVPGKGKEYDAYTDMVNRFVNDYGIPRSEIAYIQEAPTEEKRKDLFQRVRDGKVRILIGGTKNMGTGVNVQDRITDMHMLTVPWTPAALEQCIGRGGRQGNLVARDFMNNKVRVHYYATEGSLDLYKYQLLDAKGKMITQFKMGTVSGTRSFDEGSADEDGNMDPAEMVAILSGNPVIFEKAKQEKLVKKLRALRNGFERDYQRKKAKYDELQRRKENLERLIRLNDRDRADLEREGFKPDDKGVYPSTVTINDSGSYYGGRTFDKPKEAGEYLLAALDKGKTVTLQGFGQRARVAIVNEEKGNSLFSFRELEIGEGNERSIRYSVRLSDDATAAGTAYRNLLKRIMDNGDVYHHALEEVKSQLSGMNIGDGIFPRQAEYEEANAKLKELTAEFNKLSKKQETNGDGNKYRLIEERELLDFLDAQPLKKGYRYSQWANMGVLPPMTAKQNGEWRAPMIFSRWEQSEEGMRKENGKADLVQGNGRTTGDVAYNPYFHIRTSPLNDQFTAAYDRPELLVVEGYYPESEETSGYQAEGAKDSVGLMDWHSGSVNGQLSDDTKVQTMLSRYFKPVHIVPWSEVADLIMERVGDQKITFPINAVPPMLRAELAKRGAKFGDISGSVAEADIPMLNELRDRVNAGEWGAGLEKARAYLDAYESSTEAKEARVADLSARANTPVHIVRTQEEADALPTRRERRAKGWWSAKDDEVVIVLPNNVNVADVDNTFVHEVAGHKGLRAFIGEERFDEFLGEIYDHASNPIRKVIDKMTDRMVSEEADRLRVRKAQTHERAGEDVNANYYTDMAEARVEAEKKREEFRKEATEEYMSDLGGRIGSEGFEKMSRDELTLWGKIKAKVQAFLDKFLQGLKIAKSIRLNDKDLSYILYKSWKNLRKKGVFADAEDAVMRRRTGWDDDEVTRFRDPGLGLEETITKMKAEAMQANTDNLQAKRDAMRAIGGNLNHLRQAMARQREYDITTVKSVADLARVLMDANLLDDLSKYETKRILGAINNVVGKQDVSQYVQKVMDIMVDNQLRMGANTLGRLLSIRGSRVDARGIEVQGELDPDGQRIAQVVRKSTSLPKDDIDNLIAEAINRMSSTDQAIADEATIEYAGLQIARQYVEDITESKAEEKALRDSIREAESELKLGRMDQNAFNQYKRATEDAIRQNKIERAEAFHSLVEQVGGVLSESVERAKAWREAEKQRVEEIHHNANSDMEGRPTDEHHKDDRMQKLANNSFARFLLSPLATFDQMLRMFGKKNSRGEGYLWNRYMRDWVTATEKEYTGYRDALKVLDAKVSEIYGKDMTWGDLFTIDRKLPKASVRFFDGGEMKDHELTQGNILYIYMADKMSDGRMKLRRMGITEEDIEDIKNFLDPKFMQLADWMQEEFLVDKRNEYNEVHKRMFGASMAAIENYFPLKILANARLEDVDVADDATDTALPATSTGSIIKRRRNNLALDVTGANAFSVILDHLQQMERWAAFAEFNRDLNTLLSYKRFRNQVMNMSSVYGGGKVLWNNFRNVCSMAAGAYRPPIAALDKAAVNIAKGVTAAKVSFRVFTALKQFLSMPAYISDSNPIHLAANIANPYGAWKWSMENLPLFEKRWRSRMAGDPRLLKSDMDWKMWRSRVVEIASRIGMSPNAFVDALTVAIGSHAMYQSRLAKYKRYGHDPDVAEARAKQDATILFNQTQQSSESAFLSTMQVDRSWLSVLFTVFRNSSMSYTRQLYDSIRNLSRRFSLGYKGLSEEFMAKQMRRDGIDPDKADRNAKQEFRRGIIRDLVRVGIFGYVLQLAWNLGSYLPYLIFGNDDDEKDKMWQDVWNHSMFGSIEGLTGGDVMSAAGNMWVSGEGNPQYLTKDMPLVSDVFAILKKIDKDKVSAMNDVINLLVQSTIGVNPQSLTDPVIAVIDACGNDAQTSRECALLMARIINCPQSQLDKIYFDELGATGEEASQMTPYEIAERYARYKVRRGAPLTGWAYGNEQREKLMDKYRKKSNTLAKERLTRETDTRASQNMVQWLEEFEATKDRVSEIKKAKSRNEDRYYELLDELEMTPEYERYEIIKGYKRDVDALTKEWLNATTAAQRDSCVQAIIGLKGEMARELIDTQQ